MEKELVKLRSFAASRICASPAPCSCSTRASNALRCKKPTGWSIPVFAILDTNCDPDGITYPIPGNDDAIRSIKLITSRLADACIEGRPALAAGRAGKARSCGGQARHPRRAHSVRLTA